MNTISESFFPKISKEEYLPLFKAFAFFFFVLASWYAIRPVRNEMAVQGGIFNLPWLLLAVMVAMLVINPIYSWVVSKIQASRVVIYTYSFFIFNLILFLMFWNFSEGNARIWTGRAFYIWCNVYSFFVVSIFWVAIINFFNSSDAKRLFGIISAGGSLGAFFGSSVARFFSTELCGNSDMSDLGPMYLISFSIAFLTIALFMSRGLIPDKKPNFNDDSVGGSGLEAFKNIIKEPTVRYLSIYVVLFTMLMTTSWMISLGIVESWSSDPCERTAFFARIEQIVTPLTLIIQVFITSYVLRRFNIFPVLILYGFLFMLAFIGYASYPEIITVLVITVCLRLFEYALNKPTRETIYTELKKQDRYKSTVMIDTFIARSGDVMGGWFVRSLVASGFIVLNVAWAALPIALLMSYVGYRISLSTKKNNG